MGKLFYKPTVSYLFKMCIDTVMETEVVCVMSIVTYKVYTVILLQKGLILQYFAVRCF